MIAVVVVSTGTTHIKDVSVFDSTEVSYRSQRRCRSSGHVRGPVTIPKVQSINGGVKLPLLRRFMYFRIARPGSLPMQTEILLLQELNVTSKSF